MPVLNFLVSVLVLILVAGAIAWLIEALKFPQPWANAARLTLGVIFILVLIGWLLGVITLPTIRS